MEVVAQPMTFGQFLLDEMDKRHLSERAFAEFVGVDNKTINKFIKHGSEDVGNPSLEVLAKISNATHTDICTLLALVMPDVVRHTSVTPQALVLGQRIDQLPDNIKDTIDGILTKLGG